MKKDCKPFFACCRALGKLNSLEATNAGDGWARRVEDILAGFGDVLSKTPADLGSSPSESVVF